MKKFFKIFVLLMFAACFFAGCKGEVENGTPEEVDEPDDLTLLDKVQRLFSDEDIEGLTQNISNSSDYIFPDGTYKCQFLISSVHDGVQVIESCVWGINCCNGNQQGDYIYYNGYIYKDSNFIVLVASSKTAKQNYDINQRYPEYFGYNGHGFGPFISWKGLIGYYDECGTMGGTNLWGHTVTSLIPVISQNASSMQTNSTNDKYYVHKTVNETDIQICMTRESSL